MIHNEIVLQEELTAHPLKKLWRIIKKLWRDPVVSRIIGLSIWWILPIAVIGLSKINNQISYLLKKEIALYLILICCAVIFFILSIIFIIFGKSKFKKSNKYKQFKVGDVVKMKSGGFNSSKYTVIDKKYNKIIAVDDANDKQEFSPDSLFSTMEINDYFRKNREAMAERRNRN